MEQQPPVNTPVTLSVTNSGQNTMVLTSSDGNIINMGDVMDAIMMQITSVNKMVSKQEEFDLQEKTSRGDRGIKPLSFNLNKHIFRRRKRHPF